MSAWARAALGRLGAQRGSALAEMAVVLPFLLLILFGMAYFGMYLYTSIVVELAAGQSARMLAASLVEEYDKQPDDYKADEAVKKAGGYAAEIVKKSLSASNLVKVLPQCIDVEGQNAVQVSVSYKFDMTVPFMDQWGASGGGRTITRTAVYRVEWVAPPKGKEAVLLCPLH